MKWNRLPQMIVTACLGLALGWMSLSSGCNKQFIGSLGGEQNLPTTPGKVNAVQIRFYNAAAMPPTTGMEFAPSWRYAGGGAGVWGGAGAAGMQQGEDFGLLVPCNITVATLGDVTDPTVAGAWLVYKGGLDPVYSELKPLGKILQNGVDFRCGDTITFIAINDSAAKEGYSLTYNVQSGQDAPDTYSGPDAFSLFETESNDFLNLIAQGLYPVI